MPTPRPARPSSAWPLAELPEQSLGLARARFFAHNDFGPDGGYDAPHQDAILAGVPYRTPNPPMRAEALRRHDLHHLLTGYRTDWLGEAYISAWELGTGGPGRVLYAWTIALWGLFTGLIGDPRGSLRAFVRGRGSGSLYEAQVDRALLQRTVADVGRALKVRAQTADGAIWHRSVSTGRRLLDALAFAAWSTAATAYVLVALPGLVGLALAGMIATARAQLSVCSGRCVLRAA